MSQEINETKKILITDAAKCITNPMKNLGS